MKEYFVLLKFAYKNDVKNYGEPLTDEDLKNKNYNQVYYRSYTVQEHNKNTAIARAMEKADEVATDEGLKESLMRYAIESGAIVERVYQQEMNPIIEDMKRYMDGLLHIYDYGKGGKVTSDLFKLPLEARDRLNEQND